MGRWEDENIGRSVNGMMREKIMGEWVDDRMGRKWEYEVGWGRDLQAEHERYLVEEHFKRPVILTGYPKDIKALYMKQNDDGKTVGAMDVLFPGIGEIIQSLRSG